MAGFNFVEAASKGYRFVWDERPLFLRLAFWPVVLKIATLIVVASLNLETNFLRQGLMLLPAYFLEGWLVAVAIRMAIFGEYATLSASAHTSQTSADPFTRQRCIMAGAVTYVLLKLAASLLMGLFAEAAQREITAPPPPDPTVGAYFTVLVGFAIVIWAFRYVWIYIPVVFGYPARQFLKRIAVFSSSFYMLGLWFVTMVPLALLTIAFAKLLNMLLPGVAADVPSLAYIYAASSLQAVMDTLLALISSVGMAYGFREILAADNSKKTLF